MKNLNNIEKSSSQNNLDAQKSDLRVVNEKEQYQAETTSEGARVKALTPIIANNANFATDLNDEKEDEESESPLISESVYQTLPDLLLKPSTFLSGRERDIYFISQITLLSGITNNLYGIYDRKKTYTELFSVVSAFAATGKSKVLLSYDSLRKVNERICSEPVPGTIFSLNSEVKPKNKRLFIPGDTSTTSFTNFLYENDGRGIMLETEADALLNSMSQEWGAGTSVNLRKAFHNETISSNKLSGPGEIEVLCPRVAMCLTGTPNQLFRMQTSFNDGLLSRCIFYINKNRGIWRSPFQGSNTDEYFKEELAELVLNYYLYWKDLKSPVIFKLTTNQEKKFEEYFRSKTEWLQKHYPYLIDASIFRMGNIIFRIMMLLTSIRAFEKRSEMGEQLECSEEDFRIGMELIPILLEHLFLVLKDIPKGTFNTLGYTEDMVLNSMKKSEEYLSSDLVAQLKAHNKGERSIRSAISKLVKLGYLKNVGTGTYVKIREL